MTNPVLSGENTKTVRIAGLFFLLMVGLSLFAEIFFRFTF